MTRRAAEILEILAERRTVEPRVMIVVAHPDDETIGMGAQLCGFHDALLLQVTDGAPRDGRDAAAHGFANIADYAFAAGASCLPHSRQGEWAASGPRSSAFPTKRLVSIS
jgi:LmbE family N-acetylglucosaminyl deacetylase